MNPCSVVILQQETKVTVLDINLLGNGDPSLSSSESDIVNQGWSASQFDYVVQKIRYVKLLILL